MRTEFEIQKAHDMLAAIVHDEVPCPTTPEHRLVLHGIRDALCWVLEHQKNQQAFATNLQKLDAALEQRGYKMIQGGKE